MSSDQVDLIVIGAGPAGMIAALRAAELGAQTALIARDEFGGMAANDGPVPVRTLAHAARLIRDVRQLGQYGIGVNEPALDYARLLARVREVVSDVREHSSVRQKFDSLGVTLHEKAGTARCRPAHHRNRRWATASGRKIHHLHWRRKPAPACARLRANKHP